MVAGATLRASANLVKLLPTGTIFLFMFLKSAATNKGNCQTNEKILTIVLLFVSGVLCVFSSFTDSYKDGNVTLYGIVTSSGRLWPNQLWSDDYKLKFGDYFYALLSLVVLSVMVLLDPYIMNCLYPSFQTTKFLKWLPVIAGGISTISAFFPHKRHGFGYHYNTNKSDYNVFR